MPQARARIPYLPPRIGGLLDLATNLWWSWSNDARSVFRAIDEPLWHLVRHNPLELLRRVDPPRLAGRAADPGFLAQFDRVMDAFSRALTSSDTWFQTQQPGLTRPVASQARDLLVQLGAFSADGRPTDHARRMAELPLHPRLAHMMLRAVPVGLADLACEVAALLSERDILHGPRERQNADVRVRLDVLRGQYDSIGLVVNRAAVDRVRRTARLSRRQLIREQSR